MKNKTKKNRLRNILKHVKFFYVLEKKDKICKIIIRPHNSNKTENSETYFMGRPLGDEAPLTLFKTVFLFPFYA